jgi:hypothetical protein
MIKMLPNSACLVGASTFPEDPKFLHQSDNSPYGVTYDVRICKAALWHTGGSRHTS